MRIFWHGIPFPCPENTAVFGVYAGDNYEKLTATIMVNYMHNPKIRNFVYSQEEMKIIMDFIESETFDHKENEENYLFFDSHFIYLNLKIVRFN